MLSESKILEVARSVRADAWVDFASGGAFSVGFADNIDAATYNATAARVAVVLGAAGFKVRVKGPSAAWPYAVIKVLP